MVDVKRPALRYFGGKWRLAPWIISHMPAHRIYVEPFGGAASVLLQKPRAYAEIYNDLDDEVYSFFCILRDPMQCHKLRRLLKSTPFSRRDFELASGYHPDSIERARRMLIRSFMGFGADSTHDRLRSTGFRSNSNRSGTTPAHDWVNYANTMHLLRNRMQGVVIENKDASELMEQHDSEETLHYLDPPYLPETRTRPRARNYRHEMSNDDHVNLLAKAMNLKGKVIISGYDNALYNEALVDWKKETRTAYADGAQKRLECLWIKG